MKSLVLKGRAMSGFNGVTAQPLDTTHSVTIKFGFPDRYVRVDEREGTLQRGGFYGLKPIHEIKALSPDVRVGVNPPTPDFVERQKVPVAHWLLGMLTDTKGMLDVKVAPVPGSPNLLLATGPGMFSARIDLDAASGMPLRVRYDDKLFIRQPLTAEDRKAGRMQRGQNEDVEVIITFEDRRAVDGLMLPHRIVRTVKGVRWEEIRFQTIAVNTPLTAADFQ
ncbi:MAG: hypothetical protein WD690_01680 [Vicinamibacterales bacterium]